MKKMYLVKQGWNTQLLFDNKKDAMDALELFERGQNMESEYINGKGSFYKVSDKTDRELSVAIVSVYTQEEIDANKPQEEEI